MKKRDNRTGMLFMLTISAMLSLLPGRNAYSATPITVVTILKGRVTVQVEPHGSIRAKVFRGQTLQYEFILERETQQPLSTRNIERANIYLVGRYGEELIIDDVERQKRFVLSMFDQGLKPKGVPAVRFQSVNVKGYAVSLLR